MPSVLEGNDLQPTDVTVHNHLHTQPHGHASRSWPGHVEAYQQPLQARAAAHQVSSSLRACTGDIWRRSGHAGAERGCLRFEAVPLPPMSKEVCPQARTGKPHPDAHRRAAIPVSILSEGLCTQGLPELPRADMPIEALTNFAGGALRTRLSAASLDKSGAVHTVTFVQWA